jgi:hypothetical protein
LDDAILPGYRLNGAAVVRDGMLAQIYSSQKQSYFAVAESMMHRY